jgi:hypothetical protein
MRAGTCAMRIEATGCSAIEAYIDFGRSDMTGDRLFLLKPRFEDPEQPGRFFVCSHCNAIEGLLASFPGLATQIEVRRLGTL